MKGKVYFVGAGPGDPELLTLKGWKALQRANLIIFPGSLLSSTFWEFLQNLPKDKVLIDSFQKTLEELISTMEEALLQGKDVVRLVSGDPALYSSIMEQIESLRQKGFAYEIIPGVSSAFAASARLGIELTYPNLSHTVILTRFKGKTGGATPEEIKAYAKTKSTLVFFLSGNLLPKLCETLLEVLPSGTPACLIYRVCHPEEKVFFTTLNEASEIAKENNLTRTTLLVVGEVLRTLQEDLGERSYLYGGK